MDGTMKKITDLTKRVKRLLKSYDLYEIQCSSAAELMQDVADFDLSVTAVGCEGIVVLNVSTSSVACISDCLAIIKETGTLSEDQHCEVCI